MSWTGDPIELGKQLHLAVEGGDTNLVRSMCSEHPWLVTDFDWNGYLWGLKVAARRGHLEMVSTLLGVGFGVNAVDPHDRSCALMSAIDWERDLIVEMLLAAGANPNLGRSLIAALSIRDAVRRRRYVEQLIAHGVDVNQIHDLYGDIEKGFTALDWAQSDVEMAAYLREHGAKHVAELRAQQTS